MSIKLAVGDVIVVNLGDYIQVKKMPRKLKISDSYYEGVTVGEQREVTDIAMRKQYAIKQRKTRDDIINVFRENYNIDFTQTREWDGIIEWNDPLGIIRDFADRLTPRVPTVSWDSTELVGEYVILTTYQTTHNITDWGRTYGQETVDHIYAKKLLDNGEYDPDGVEIGVEDNFTPIRRMSVTFI